MKGQIVSLSGSNYTVLSDGKEYLLTARGKLKLKKENLLVGDYVEFNNGAIERVEERSSSFIRPSVANVDLIVAVLSFEPKPDLTITDKLIASAFKEGVEVVFVVNKTDVSNNLYQEIIEEYKDTGIKILDVSAKTGHNLDKLKDLLKGRFTAFAGQSAVGKSSLLNALFSLNIKTGELSTKISRGKHTTTKSTIYVFDDIKIIDTPGFYTLESDIDVEFLAEYYPEYEKYIGKCKFRCCTHTGEPDCVIKNLVENGELSSGRYQRYLSIYNELKTRRKSYE